MGNRNFQGFPESALALQLLSVGYVFVLLASMGRLIARGIGIPQYEMRSSVIIVVLNISLSIVLILNFGFIGALLGTSLSGIIGSTYFFYSYNRRLKESIFRILKKIFALPFFFCALALILSLLAGYLFRQIHPESPDSRIQAFIYLLVNGLVFLGVYLVFLFKSAYIDKYDKEIFSGFLEMLRLGFKRKK